jgi:hypothetical protein
MPRLRGNLHAHSTFSDGVLPAARLVAEYERLGYDFLAITDHEDRIGEGYWSEIRKLAPRLILFHGVELNYPGFPQHVGRVLGDRETLHVLNHPARYRLTLEQTAERIERIAREGLRLDAVEVTDTGLYRPLYDADALPLARIATDDAHRPAHLARAWIEVEARRDRDAIIRAVRAGDFRLGFRPGAPGDE